MEIMKLIPTGKDYLWGGTRLREEYGKKIDLTPLAETWECSVHPDGPSYVANGTYKGKTLAEVLKEHPEYLGTKVENGELPVLVKFIDAKKDLSVQVHPSDELSLIHIWRRWRSRRLFMGRCVFLTREDVCCPIISREEMRTRGLVPIRADGSMRSWKSPDRGSICRCMRMREERISLTRKTFV